mgnify:FL=1
MTMVLGVAMASAGAQSVDNRAVGYSVRYEKEHLFLQKDSGLNVVDYDIEWPEVVGYSHVPTLQRFISQALTGKATLGFDSLATTIRQRYGKPVTKMFDKIPDDRRFCYVMASARVVGYEPNHWIAYHVGLKVAPGKLSAFQAEADDRVVVCDLATGKMHYASNLVSSNIMNRNEPQGFYDLLFQPLDDNFFNAMTAYEIDGVWVTRGQLCFLIKATSPDASKTYIASMPLDAYSYALSRQGKRLFTKKAELLSPQVVAQQNVMEGDSIYSNVEKQPEMKGGSDALRQYLSHVSQPAVRLAGPVKVYTSFVVDKNGKVRDVCVLQPVDPVIDRHAAQTVKGMPSFTPGQHCGKNVLVRMYMPITYQP